MNIRLLTTLFLCLWVMGLSLVAQPTNCLFFDDLEVGTTWGISSGNTPGQTIYSVQGTTITLGLYTNLNENSTFGDVTVAANQGFGTDEPYLFINNTNLVFEWGGPANNVCFTASRSGLPINFGINGQVGVYESLLDPRIATDFPDFDISASVQNNLPSDPVQVCIFGTIESLTMGGIEQIIDNVCADYYPNPDCGFYGPVIQAYCLNGQSVSLGIDFQDIVGNNDFVDVLINGNLAGSYPIAAFPLNLNNIIPSGQQDSLIVTVCINDIPECCYSEVVFLPVCEETGCVGFEIYGEEMSHAIATGFPYDSIYYREQGITFTTIQVQKNGVILPPSGTLLRLLAASIPAFTNANFVNIGHLDAASRIDFTGYSAPVYSVSLDFFNLGPAGSVLNIGVNGQSVIQPTAPYQTGNVNYTLSNGTRIRMTYSQANPNEGTITILSQNITEIIVGGEYVSIDNLCLNNVDCSISNLAVGQYACENDDLPSRFYLHFEHNALAQDSFQLTINNELYGTFSYNSLPLTNLELATAPGTAVRFLVRDIYFENCAEDLTIEAHNCANACADFAATTATVYCTGLNEFNVGLVLSTPPTWQTIRMTGLSNGQTNAVDYTSPNGITLNFFGEPDPEGYRITDELTGCETILPPLDININDCQECEFFDVSLTPTACNPNGVYRVVVDFQTTHPDGQFVVVVGNNQTFGPFGAVDFPVTVGSILGSNQEPTAVTIMEVNGFCIYTGEIVHQCNTCANFSAQLDFVECITPGQTIQVGVFLTGIDTGEPLRIVSLPGNQVIETTFQGNPLVLELPATNTGELIIQAQGINCEAIVSYTTPENCVTNCDNAFAVVSINCVEGQPQLIFTANGPADQPFVVRINGGTYSFLYGQNVYVVDLTIPANANNRYNLRYADAATGCVREVGLDNPCPGGGACNFANIFAEPYACDGNSFQVDIEFDNPNGGPLGFYIFGDGMIFGPYAYGQNFYTFGPLNGTNTQHTILILDIANPACFGNYNFNYTCSTDCNIQEVVATASDCDGDFFSVSLDVSGTNLGETFTVVGNGANYGTFSYADLPINLGPFAGNDETIYEFGVIDLQNPGCTNWTEIGPINCRPCAIRDFVYEVDCAATGYALTIDFIYENPTSDRFALLIGGDVVEWFLYEDLPLTLQNLPFSLHGATIRVEDVDNELCGQTLDFDLPCCSLGNALNELTVAACEANGDYYLSIGQFNGGNLSDTLLVDYAPAGSSIIATVAVAYTDLPATVGPLMGDGNTAYLIVLRDAEHECAVTTTIEPVFCDNSSCVEFEGISGVFGPSFGYDSGDLITTENEVRVTYQRNPASNCACNVFVTDGDPSNAFGEGHIIATQNAGLGLDFTGVTVNFNTVNIDFYYPGGGLTVRVNDAPPVTVANIADLPAAIGFGVALQVTLNPNDPTSGMLTLSGENIDHIYLYSNENAAFDNVCLSLDDNVWPGDTNADNIANHIDLLSIGLTYGLTGPSRQAVTDEWAGLISQNWGESFADGTNHKHADANGDGQVDAEDRQVLIQNYGRVHGEVEPFVALPYTDLDPPVVVDLAGIEELAAGAAFQIPVVAGSIDQQIADIYGLAFTLHLDPEIFVMSSLEIIYPTSWFGEPGVNTTSIHQYYGDGRLEVALTRTDHNNVSGFGPILYIRGIIDDIAGIADIPTELILEDALGIDHDERQLALRPGRANLLVTKTAESMDRELLRSSFGIYPNPTSGRVFFRNAYSYAPDRVRVFNAAAQHLATFEDPGMRLDLKQLPAGVYFLKIHLEGYIFTERVVKLE
ncbi:MAG: hypothetical protein DA408_04375 [Bacteroidetes bacterium]|nr:MAG: hypothetical protein DA408_04375 [Bacteroidota bacterium]